MAVVVLFGEQEVRNKSIASFQECTRQVRYTPVADISLRRSEPPLRAMRRHFALQKNRKLFADR
jgi:hypothetical protein